MEFAFYLSATIAVLATFRVISCTVPVHALLYFVISLLAISGVFFSLGANFAGALEIIVYAGAIMVLFVFVVMMLNIGQAAAEQEKKWLQPRIWLGPAALALILLVMLITTILNIDSQETMSGKLISAKEVGQVMFSSYLLAVELISMVLLAALVVAFHLGQEPKKDKRLNLQSEEGI